MEYPAFRDAQTARNYLFSGSAVATLRSGVTGAHFTYELTQPDDKVGTAFFFARLRTGEDFTYLGIVASGRFRLTGKSRLAADSAPVRAIQFALAQLAQDRIPAGLDIMHNGRCGRCGRELTNPESIATGLGPICAGRGFIAEAA